MCNPFGQEKSRTYNLADVVRDSKNGDVFNAVVNAFAKEIRHLMFHSAKRLYLRPTVKQRKKKTSFLYKPIPV